MAYKHGIGADQGETISRSTVQTGTNAVYVGTAPVNLLKNGSDYVNKPLRMINWSRAVAQCGYSDDWESFTLCEAMRAHFFNANGAIAPIYMINVLDPVAHKAEESKKVSLNFANGSASFADDKAIIDSFKIADKVAGTDYDITYNFTKSKFVVTSDKITGTVDATYDVVDPTKVTAEDVIGGVSDQGEMTGLSAIELVYSKNFDVVNLIAAPGFSENPKIYQALCSAAHKINNHFDAFVEADIPLVGADNKLIDTYEKAIDWKSKNGVNNSISSVWWPRATGADGNVYHLSTLATVEQMRIDYANENIPMETCSNKSIPVIKQYFGVNSVNNGFGEVIANELNSAGIGTAIPSGGQWVLWGGHTAAYQYGVDNDASIIFDVSIRMIQYIMNGFQQRHASKIDRPMTTALRDAVVEEEQSQLDSLVGAGALLRDAENGTSPTITFVTDGDSYTNWVNGEFYFDGLATPTPEAHYFHLSCKWSDAGYTSFTYGGEE